MNRDDLDDFFARADDVLTDWRPSADAMVARVPAAGVDTLPPRIDSYYDQGSGLTVEQREAFARCAAAAAEGLANMARNLQNLSQAFARLRFPAPPVTKFRAPCPSNSGESPADRALRLRRQRNTGPQSKVGLDGHFRRH